MRKPFRILIVDDNEPLAENLLEIIEDEGMQGTICTEGAIALQSLEVDSAYDLVLTDFRMPRMDGVELARRIKASLPELPVIMLSAYLGDLDRDAAREAGVVEVLGKPEDLQQLIERVQRLSAARSGDDA